MMYLRINKKMMEAAEEVLNPQVDFVATAEEFGVDELTPYEMEEIEGWWLDNAIHEFLRSFGALAPYWGTQEWCDLYWNVIDYCRWWGNPTPEGLIQITFSWISHEKGIIRKQLLEGPARAPTLRGGFKMSYEVADTAMTMLVLWLTFRVPVLAAQKKASVADAAVALTLWIIWWLV